MAFRYINFVVDSLSAEISWDDDEVRISIPLNDVERITIPLPVSMFARVSSISFANKVASKDDQRLALEKINEYFAGELAKLVL